MVYNELLLSAGLPGGAGGALGAGGLTTGGGPGAGLGTSGIPGSGVGTGGGSSGFGPGGAGGTKKETDAKITEHSEEGHKEPLNFSN